LSNFFLIKRCIDLTGALIVAIVTLPVMLLVAILVKLEDFGSVFYRAERVGLNQRAFQMLKFRTMRQDADKTGPGLTQQGDPRITKIGRVLRRLSIDELPQIINVLRGEMSLIGPRPEIAEIVDQYSNEQLEALSVRPGITGLSQVNGRDDLSIEEKVGFDLQYVRNLSMKQELTILAMTLPAVVSARGNRF